MIRLWDRIIVPIPSGITGEAAQRLASEVLNVIYEGSARGLVIDVDAAVGADAEIATAVANLAATARMMEAPAVVVGASPALAAALAVATSGLDAIPLAPTLEEALTSLGLRVQRDEG